jgi:hypothetical protein
MRNARRLIFLIFALWVPTVGQAVDDANGAVLEHQFAAETDTSSNAVPASHKSVADSKVCTLESALKMQGQKFAERMQVVPPPPTSHQDLMLAVALLLAAVLAFRKITSLLNDRLNLGIPLSAGADNGTCR